MLRLISLIFIIIFYNFNLYGGNIGSVTGFELPRFVSLKSNDINLRIGSSTNYPVILNYNKKNLPIQIIDEYKNWRKISDINDNVGWIHKNLLKGERYGITQTNDLTKNKVSIFSKPNGNLIGEIGESNIVRINVCLVNWCNISIKKYKGWILKEEIWGIYKDENFDIPFYQYFLNIMWKFY